MELQELDYIGLGWTDFSAIFIPGGNMESARSTPSIATDEHSNPRPTNL
jgi:hypothetical protein